jgi:ligand-binding SRPBCC domain-containing protein
MHHLLATPQSRLPVRRVPATISLVGNEFSFTISSRLAASVERVWDHASTFAGVNRELWPPIRMTYPIAIGRLTPKTIPLGRCAFRSWILLFGFLPIEFDNFTIVELEPGRGFYEVSSLLTIRDWRHRRSIELNGDGCVVRDEIALVPRWRPLGRPLLTVYRQVFELRHRRLRRIFGGQV